MSGLTATVPGVDPLAGDLVDAGRALVELGGVFEVEGRRVLDAAVIPRDTGHLASTVAVVAGDDGFALTAAATYAGYVHAVDPFFSRPLAASADDVERALVAHAESTLSTIGP